MSIVELGSKVTLHFILSMETGEVIDNTREKEPGQLEIGDGTLPKGFEQAVIGMEEGERKVHRVTPEQAFGMPNPSNIQRFSASQFVDQELSEGLMISFSDAANAGLAGVVIEFDESEVVVDFNHPLAGKTLLFDVEIFKTSTV